MASCVEYLMVAGIVIATFGYSTNYASYFPFLHDDLDYIYSFCLSFVGHSGLCPSSRVDGIADV